MRLLLAWALLAGLAAAVPAATGCAAAGARSAAPAADLAPAAVPPGALPVPLVRQATDYSCGAAVMAAVLYYWRAFDGMESDLYEGLETTEEHGTEPRSLVRVARAHGLEADLRTGLDLDDLRAALARGETAILDLQAWRDEEKRGRSWSLEWDDGHYVVLVALDERFIYVMDPSSPAGYAYVPVPEFLERWRDYEDRHGPRVEYVRAAVLVRGKEALRTVPGPLWRME